MVTNTTMVKTDKREKVAINFEIPVELNYEWRKVVQEKYGIYRHGLLTEVLEESIRNYIKSEKK